MTNDHNMTTHLSIHTSRRENITEKFVATMENIPVDRIPVARWHTHTAYTIYRNFHQHVMDMLDDKNETIFYEIIETTTKFYGFGSCTVEKTHKLRSIYMFKGERCIGEEHFE